MKNIYKYTFRILALIFILANQIYWGQNVDLEFATGGGNPTGNGPVSTTTINFQKNTNNYTGNTFAAHTPTLSATYTLSNQQYTSSVNNSIVNIGYDAGNPVTVYTTMNSHGGASDTNFTSSGATTGNGISVANNYGVRIMSLTYPLRAANVVPSSTTPVQVADLKISFNRPVNNPILHFAGLGGVLASGLGITTQFTLISSNLGSLPTLSKLSGTSVLDVNSTQINNNAASITATGSGTASGSVLVSGIGITDITFRLYIRPDTGASGSTSWASTSTDTTSGDTFTIGVSTLENDLAITKTVNNSTPTVGSNVIFSIGATNNGPSNDANVSVNDVLPTGYTFVSSSPSVGTYNNSTGVWSIGNLNSGSSATLQITASVNSSGSYSNTATISGANSDSSSSNNSATASTTPTSLLVANNDSFSGGNSGTVFTTSSVLSNDTINGSSANTSNVTVSGVTVPSGFTLNADGTITKSTSVTPGFYNIVYKICDINNNSICTNATVTITVGKQVTNTCPTLTVNLNTYSSAAPPAGTVLEWHTSLPISSSNKYATPTAATAGTYYAVYYDATNNCYSPESVPVNVLIQECIDAVNDDFSSTPINGLTGGSSASVLTNDLLNGITATSSTVNISQVSTTNTGVNINTSTGAIVVSPNTPAGTYTVTYQICSKTSSSVCDTATAQIVVPCNAGSTAPTLSSTTINVTCPNTFNLNSIVTSATPSGATLKWYTDNTHTNEVANATAITSGGTYYAYYYDSTGNCWSPVSVAVSVTFHSPAAPTVSATTLTNICPSRSVNLNSLVTSATPSGTSLWWYKTTDLSAPLADPTNVTTSGTYYAKYHVDGSCSATDGPFWSSIITVTITDCIDAVNDDFTSTPINGINGGSTSSILSNDTLNGSSFVLSSVNLSQLSTTNTNVNLNVANGTISVAPNTPAGTYTVTYQICSKAFPTICDTANVLVTVSLPAIDAVNDSQTITNGSTGTVSVLNNDTFNGGTAGSATLSNVNLTQISTTSPNVTLNTSNGLISVAPNTLPGTYTINYQICDKINTSNCDTASVLVTVPAIIDAQNDINQTPQGVSVSGNTIANDSSSDNSAISIQSASYLNASGVPTALVLGTPTQVYDANNVLAGTITLNSNGTYTFVPTATYVGTVPVNYVATNTTGSTDSALLSIEVIANTISGNDKPIAQDDTATTEINTTVSSNVLVNDSDPDGNSLTVSSASILLSTGTIVSGIDQNGNAVSNAGTLTLNSNGTYTFVPATGFMGTVNPVTYTVSDGNGGTDTATLSIRVLPNYGNDTYANDDANSAPQGVTMTGNVLSNDTDPEGNTQSVTSATVNGTLLSIGSATVLAGVGTLTLNSNGSYTFVPLPSFKGNVSVVYSVCDNGTPVSCDTATLYLTSLNVPFVDAQDDINQIPQNHSLTGSVLTNDSSSDNSAISVQSAMYMNASGTYVSLPFGVPTSIYDTAGNLAGTLTFNSDGTYTFVPLSNYYNGTDIRIKYTSLIPTGDTDDAILKLIVIQSTTPANDKPIAQSDTAYTEVNTPVTSNALANDSDPDGDTLTIVDAVYNGIVITIGSPFIVPGFDTNGNPVANAGSITINSNGSYTFVPASGFIGYVNNIHYNAYDSSGKFGNAEITINVFPNTGNDVFANDDANSAIRGTTMTGNILINDTDPESNAFTVSSATANGISLSIGSPTVIPGIGTLTINANGTYTFVPEINFIGTLPVVYTVCDNGSPVACDTATLYLTTLDVSIIDAQNDYNQTSIGVSVNGNVLTNDSSTDNLNINVQSASYLNASGVPTALVLGTPTQVYDANNVLAGTITLNSNGTYTFVPTATYVGTVPLTYVASNSNNITDSATLNIEVIGKPTNGNDKPIAQDDTATTEINTTVSSNVLVNDSDPDGNSLTVSSASIPLSTATIVSGIDQNGNAVSNAGTLTLNSNGTYTFVPATGFMGTVNPVTYTVSDGNGGTDTATLSIRVLPNYGNDTYANDDANSAPQGVTMTGNVLSNDTDPEGNTQSVTSATVNGTLLSIGSATVLAGVGTLTLNSNGSYTFVPLPSFKGNVSVVYSVCDNGTPVSCDTATLMLTTYGNSFCYKPAVLTGTVLDTNHGITALGRAGNNIDTTTTGIEADNWPMVRKGAWTALEAKTKGFVVNRLTDAQISAIPATDLREGMMVYNITQDCLQINVDGTSTGWKCFNTQTCPD